MSVQTRRRGGTVVLGAPISPRARRFELMVRVRDTASVDLANLRGDLLERPDLRRAVAFALERPEDGDPGRSIDPLLDEVALRRWPVPGAQFTATHGLPDATELILAQLVRRGQPMLVESPTHPRVLDVVDLVGGVPVPVPWGPHGPRVEALQAGLNRRPAAFVYQPTGSIPTGRSVSQRWLRAAAEVLERTGTPVVELDNTPLLAEPRSLGSLLPAQVIRAESFQYFFGLNLRVALVGGPEHLLDPLRLRLTYSTRYVSTMQQRALAFVLTDDDYRAATERVVAESVRRREALTAALADAGCPVELHRVPSMWVPVADEHDTVVRLPDRGVIVYPGAHCRPQPSRATTAVEGPHIHVGSTGLAGDYARYAAAIAEAAHGPDPSARARRAGICP